MQNALQKAFGGVWAVASVLSLSLPCVACTASLQQCHALPELPRRLLRCQRKCSLLPLSNRGWVGQGARSGRHGQTCDWAFPLHCMPRSIAPAIRPPGHSFMHSWLIKHSPQHATVQGGSQKKAWEGIAHAWGQPCSLWVFPDGHPVPRHSTIPMHMSLSIWLTCSQHWHHPMQCGTSALYETLVAHPYLERFALLKVRREWASGHGVPLRDLQPEGEVQKGTTA